MSVAFTTGMPERLTKHAHFWSALTVATGTGGFFAVQSELPANTSLQSGLLNILGAGGLPALSFSQIAPFLSLAAFALAIAGWRRLHRQVNKASSVSSTNERDRMWHDALQANADGIFLLHAVRQADGTVIDFEITDANRSAVRMVRSTRAHLVGRRILRDYPAELGRPLIAQYSAAMDAGVPAVEDVRVNRRQFSAGWLYHQAVPTAHGVAVTIRDISERKREEVRLRRATVTDELTLLSNRRGFLTMAEQQLRIARRHAKDAVLMYIDMDDFKALNDQFGHAEGDRALVAVGRLLRRAVRDCDIVARLGGDEFTIMALDADRAGARQIQKRIEERVAMLNASGELAAPLSLTIGHTRVRPDDTAPLPELLARADGLLYARKHRRKLAAASSRSTGARTELAVTAPRQALRGLSRAPRAQVPIAMVTASS